MHHGDSTAVSIGDVVEAQKLPRTPTNQRASVLVGHGLDLDVARRKSCGNVEESVAELLVLEVSGSPRSEFARGDRPWLTEAHQDALSDGDFSSGYHTACKGERTPLLDRPGFGAGSSPPRERAEALPGAVLGLNYARPAYVLTPAPFSEGALMTSRSALLAALAFSTLVPVLAQDTPLTELPYTPGLDVSAMDRTADPCQDLYQYSCGGWMKDNPIPGDQASWSV